MILVIDTNRIVAALIRDSVSRKILMSDEFDFVGIEFSKKEVDKNKAEILEKANIGEEEFETLMKILFKRLNFLDDLTIEEFMTEAKTIMDEIDPLDTPFIAAALAVKCDIWSDDGHFQKQKRVNIWKTKDLVEFI